MHDVHLFNTRCDTQSRYWVHVHICSCTGHTYRLQNNPQQLTNNNILTMVIHFTNTSPWMITLPPTSSNRSHHTQQLSPFLEPLQLSTSRNIA